MSWMILLMPEKKKFVYQDGTIPPLFKPMTYTPDTERIRVISTGGCAGNADTTGLHRQLRKQLRKLREQDKKIKKLEDEISELREAMTNDLSREETSNAD